MWVSTFCRGNYHPQYILCPLLCLHIMSYNSPNMTYLGKCGVGWGGVGWGGVGTGCDCDIDQKIGIRLAMDMT